MQFLCGCCIAAVRATRSRSEFGEDWRQGVKALWLLAAMGGAAVALAQTAGTFTATGNMTTARDGPTATLLTDGTILIVGGSNGESGTLSGAELYDPRSGTFNPIGEMTAPRAGHTATLL